MSYLALYRRFRPEGFDGVVGQDHIVKTLINQIKTDKIGHAYLFCGARGTGKTSCAKIFARAINCLSPKNGSPCGECEVCKALKDGTSLDVVEMDAASNNKVENVREIREKIQYPPVNGRYKVYIIDEVHMLTPEAFNALLKTLEEPPKHAVFILATTEVHKIPATILSRCMRFDFKLIPTKQIAELVAKIYDEVGKEYDKESVNAIAVAGAGSIRDALSVADICVSYKEGKLTYDDVMEVLGSTDGRKTIELIKNVISSNTGKVLKSVEDLIDDGKSVGLLTKDIISRLRELIICKTCESAKEILELPDDMYEELKNVSGSCDEHRILRILEIFADAEGSLRYSLNQRVVLETACIKASEPKNDYDIDALLTRIAKLEKVIESGEIKVNAPIPSRLPEKTVKEEKIERVEEKVEIVQTETSASKLWGSVIRKLHTDRNIVLWVACQDMKAYMSGNTLKVVATDEAGYMAITKEVNLKALADAVKSFGDYDIEVVKESGKEDGFEQDVKKIEETFGVKPEVIK